MNLKKITLNLFYFFTALLAFASNSTAQLRITPIGANGQPGTTKEYPTLVTTAQDKGWYQQRTYRNSSGQQASVTIFITGSSPTTQPASLIKQGYYYSTGRSGDVLTVKINSPEFSCGTAAQTGVTEVKVFKAAYNKNLFKGEVTCPNKKITYEFGNGQPFIGATLTAADVKSATATSQQTGFEAIKLFSNGAWKSGSSIKKEKLTITLQRPRRIYNFPTLSVRRNFNRIDVAGNSADSMFSFYYTLFGNLPNDLFNFPYGFSAFSVAPRVDKITVDIDKQSTATIAEINRLSIIPENYSAWKNHICALDVNSDDRITSLDALLIINFLNSNENKVLSTAKMYNDSRPFYDTNGDGVVTAIDSLLVINAINARINTCSALAAVGSNVPGQGIVALSNKTIKNFLNKEKRKNIRKTRNLLGYLSY